MRLRLTFSLFNLYGSKVRDFPLAGQWPNVQDYLISIFIKKIKKEIQESFNNIKSNQASNNFNFYSDKYGSFQGFLYLYLKGYFAKFMKKIYAIKKQINKKIEIK